MTYTHKVLKLREDEFRAVRTNCYTTISGVIITDPFDENTALVKLYSLEPVYYEFGEDPRATVESELLPDRYVKLFAVSPGSRLSLLKAGNPGLINVIEYAHISY